MIANIIHFYAGGISVSEAKRMPFSELLRYIEHATTLNKAIKKASKDGV